MKQKKTNLLVSLKEFLKNKKCLKFWNNSNTPPAINKLYLIFKTYQAKPITILTLKKRYKQNIT
ncbi:hypothetical protein RS022_03340 [Candidatus Phytoplasma rubi]|uniref:Uncharacterized protein n=1 Tax=Candidatus Phytoplasma rubi TaxID=399025 RepID=A0ABY7BRE2_9MOLU|nr:hypothetical protein RS022_03340 [Candidatus Phytoplasma rubi]